ncbi:hypothetical protein SNOG_01889 [Parastagonospora nodorum SN15]|uniref:Uncharacterized protein n=1 Tax=Phaeosphaeria nodorum (strain SN15 / ATCC MYA-4574 / FGSC 10173) TaxID=321614 RepID=Q0V275_PHANO|nr:hypothetical protein SNOG_01889 [Parastagonospora nodorum SN15]EAT90101.2 hypothetical protein SNOG_01889 [Parastagonospora nodorum SN15]
MPFNAFSFTALPKKPHLPTSSTPHPHPPHSHPSTYLSNPSSYNPWNPKTPSHHLYRSFKSFTCAENAARLQRGEQPFCTPAGRDRAFEKLMRLSKGEEPIGWAIDEGGWDGEFEGFVDWGGQMEMEEERVGRWVLGNRGEGEEEEMRRAVEEGEKQMEKERKDSKEVYHGKNGEGEWEAVGKMRIDDKDEDEFADADTSPEHREDIGDEDDGLEDMTIC